LQISHFLFLIIFYFKCLCFQTLQDSGFGDRSSKRFNPDKENYTPGKKVRKSLNSNWAPPLLREDRYARSTNPVKSSGRNLNHS
jgi:hypothetical protein